MNNSAFRTAMPFTVLLFVAELFRTQLGSLLATSISWRVIEIFGIVKKNKLITAHVAFAMYDENCQQFGPLPLPKTPYRFQNCRKCYCISSDVRCWEKYLGSVHRRIGDRHTRKPPRAQCCQPDVRNFHAMARLFPTTYRYRVRNERVGLCHRHTTVVVGLL